MSRLSDTFLPNRANRALLPGFVAFCVALFGAALAFLAASVSLPWLGLAAYCIAGIGVLAGFCFVLLGIWRTVMGKSNFTDTD